MLKNQEEPKYGSEKWIDGFYDPTTRIQTMSQCMVLSDIYKDDDFKLVLADFGDFFSSNPAVVNNIGALDGRKNDKVKLKVFKGLAMINEVCINDIPSSIVTIAVDTLVPSIPALAISSSCYVYIYKNMKPYFRFTLPCSPLCPEEEKAWRDYQNEHIKLSELVVALDNIRGFGRLNEMTQKSVKFLQLSTNEERLNFIDQYKEVPLVKNTAITIMTSLMKNVHDDDGDGGAGGGIRCIVIGCEDGHVYVINPETFSVAATYSLPSVAVFMVANGLFDVEYSIYTACRNGGVYGIKRNIEKAREFFRVTYPIVGLVKVGKNLVVGCMDGTIHCYNTKGNCLWSVNCHGDILCVGLMELKTKNLQLLLVSVKSHQQQQSSSPLPPPPSSSSSLPPSTSGQIQIYLEKSLVDVIRVEEVVAAMKFGRYGRESDTLVMVTKSGGLMVKVLKRTALFDSRGVSKSGDGVGFDLAGGGESRIDIPKKTKLFLDQTARERVCAVEMHKTFQQDLCRLRLHSCKCYLDMLDKQLNVVSLSQEYPVKLNVEVTGLGPTFKMCISVQNTSLNVSCHHYFIAFVYDPGFYNILDNIIFLPAIGPSLSYRTSTFAYCVTDKTFADVIKVLLCTENNINPILTAVVSMPVSEGGMNF
ncbi:hypothetical protein HELRODRAFT_191614 [Helobdella robusta]|uniref:Uncharacterized protein n=1 Tax=Helobdella robusta TaxID=6412 RepID=T1FT46_HELRO|nr:hypothetical protein HELRODRAFT_191614 [Helobdella robusta]ESO04536.1 hypothetical protein HELRODRAFT_191614 [Helobdella robusta]